MLADALGPDAFARRVKVGAGISDQALAGPGMGIGVMRYRARMIGAQPEIKRIETGTVVKLAMAFEATRGVA